MTGFEMPPPVVICDTPGCLAIASIRLVDDNWCSSLAWSTMIGIGVSFILMSPTAPVTVTSFNSKCLKNISVGSGRLWAVIGNTYANDKAINNDFFILVLLLSYKYSKLILWYLQQDGWGAWWEWLFESWSNILNHKNGLHLSFRQVDRHDHMWRFLVS